MTELQQLNHSGTVTEQCLSLLFSKERIFLWQYDIKTDSIQPVQNLEQFFLQNRPLEHISKSWIKNGLIHQESENDFLTLFQQLAAGKKDTSCTIRMRETNGGYYWEKISCKILFDDHQTPVGAACVSLDVSEQMNVENQFFQEEQMRFMLSQDVIAASKVNLTKNQVDYLWSRKMEPEILASVGTYEEMYQIGLKSFITEDDKKRYQEIFSLKNLIQAFDSGKTNFNLEYHYRDYDGTVLWALMTATLLRNPSSNDIQYFSFIRDIDEKKKTELLLKEKAERDEITSLYNKGTTESMIRERLCRNHQEHDRCALIIMDLDRFKYVNDCYGHPYGDYVLAQVGRILSSTFGSHAIQGRIGGDEFVVFIDSVPSEEWVYQNVQVLCGKIRQVCILDRENAHLSVSVGIAFSFIKEASFESLYEQADIALYEAKRKGKNRYEVYQQQTRSCDQYDKFSCIAKDFLCKYCMLDELEELVFIIDFETYELLYMNKAAKEVFKIEDFQGQKCYEIIQNFSQPCPFCKRNMPREQTFLNWENMNAKLHRSFLIKDKMMYWGDRCVHFEIFFDLDQLLQGRRSERVANLLLSSIEILLSTEDFHIAMKHVLNNIGEFYRADCVQVLEFDQEDENGTVKFQWDALLGKVQGNDMQKSAAQLMPLWSEVLAADLIHKVDNVEDIKQTASKAYQLAVQQQIHSWYCVPFEKNAALYGAITVWNPSEHLNEVSFLESLTYIMGIELLKRQITERQNYINYHDSLTGVLNRNSYIEFVKNINLDAVFSMGVMIVDIDGLKAYNEKFGHYIGDELIKNVAQILIAVFGIAATYRFTGDEFLILSQDITSDVFHKKIEQVRTQTKELYADKIILSSTWANTDIDIERMIRHVNERIIITKHSRKQEDQSGCRSLMQEQLLKAIAEKRFAMYLQPKVHIDQEKVLGAEALVRYVDEKHGVVSPVKFIPLLESENLVHHIDFFIFEEVCKLLKTWIEKGYELYPISFNFSRTTLLEYNLIDKMNQVSDRYQVPRNLLEVEITESFSEMELETIREIGSMLVSNGYRSSIDDFGAQYSNLSMLSALKPDILKLDKSIVNELYSNESVKIIVENLLNICRQLGIESVAEGVETREQLEILRDLKCDYAQGYLYNKPISVPDFEKRYFSNK